VLHTPARAPKANAYCERLVGTIRRECLDFMIPLGEKHLRRILAEWVTHYNQGRPIWASDRGFLNVPRYSHDCKITTDIPFPKTARLWLAWFSAASITSTGGKGSLREGRIAQMTAAPALHW